VACHPQAWSAGAAPYLLQVCLGLQAQAFDHKLVITRPLLPPFVDWIELTGLRVGEAVVKLRFTRKSEANAAVEVVSVHGDNLDVVLVP
jgi:hypothetical protein